MGKFVSITVVIALQVSGLFAAHLYFEANPRNNLIVVDSSFGLKQHQLSMVEWVEDYMSSTRYTRFHFATDKSYLGEGKANRDKLFRVNFGTMDPGILNQKFKSSDYEKRILLTFNELSPNNWTVVRFD